MTAVRALLLACVLFGTVAASRGDEPAPTSDVLEIANEFIGKIVTVYLDENMRTPSMVLSHVELKQIGGRMFLVGLGADTQRQVDWRSGKKVRISWPSVTGYLLLTPEEYAEHLKEPRLAD
ncbi:MAG TPA: hypothetical protein VGG30_08875 [Pirellulales bacterium]